MMAALIHRPDRIEEAASTATVSTAVAGLVSRLVALAVSPLIGLIFDSDRVGEVAAVTAGLLLLHPFQVVPEALLQRRFSFLRRVDRRAAGVIAFGATAVYFCADGHGRLGARHRLLMPGRWSRSALSWGLARWRPKFSPRLVRRCGGS